MNGQAQAMDEMYRYQRYFYDLTRKYYLFGRDRLIRRLCAPDNAAVMEVGCGTARNLVLAARAYPQARFYGLDASAEMLRTARQNIERRGGQIELRQGLAEELDCRDFGLPQGCDIVFFSYALSMIRPWQPALQAGLRNLKPGGRLLIVDFADQARLPRWVGRVLQTWLARFGVRHDPGLLEHLRDLEREGKIRLQLDSLGRDYAFLAQAVKL